MTGTSITIEVDSQPVRQALGAVVAAGGDLLPLFDAIGAAMVTSTQNRFLAQAGPGGVPWPKFAPATLKRMPKRRQPPLLLRDTLRLYNSLTFEADDGSVQWGTNVIYAALHQFGGDVKHPERQASATFRFAEEGAATAKDGRRVGSRLRFARANTRAKSRHTKSFTVPEHSVRIPARPYLGVDQADEAEILATIADFLEQRGTGIEGTP